MTAKLLKILNKLPELLEVLVALRPIGTSRHRRFFERLMVIFVLMMMTVTGPVNAQGLSGSVFLDTHSVIPDSERIKHVFGGKPVSLPFTLYGAPDSKVDLKGRLFQVTKGLLVPVGKELEIGSAIVFTNGIRQVLEMELPVPSVTRESVFVLGLFMRIHAQEKWQKVGHVRLRAYPEDLLKPLRVWTEQHPFRLQDTTGKLETFLKSHGIRFLQIDAGSLEQTKGPVMTLITGDSDQVELAKDRARKGESVIMFREQERTWPHVESNQFNIGSLVTVKMQMLDDLEKDPSIQKIFLKIIDLARSDGQ